MDRSWHGPLMAWRPYTVDSVHCRCPLFVGVCVSVHCLGGSEVLQEAGSVRGVTGGWRYRRLPACCLSHCSLCHPVHFVTLFTCAQSHWAIPGGRLQDTPAGTRREGGAASSWRCSSASASHAFGLRRSSPPPFTPSPPKPLLSSKASTCSSSQAATRRPASRPPLPPVAGSG